MTKLDQPSFVKIAAEYAPYHTMPAFAQGAADYQARKYNSKLTGVDRQAWDRGQEAMMRLSIAISRTLVAAQARGINT
jgi:hypothetical protein